MFILRRLRSWVDPLPLRPDSTVPDQYVWETQRIGDGLVPGFIAMTPRSSLPMAESVTLRSLVALRTARSPLVLWLVLRRTNKEKPDGGIQWCVPDPSR